MVLVECELADGTTVTFDVTDTEADDYDDTWMLYDLYVSTVGK